MDNNRLLQLIQQLRLKTDAPIIKCKEAIIATDGDINKSIQYMRDNNVKILDNIIVADEGRIFIYLHNNNKIAVLVEIHCQTDFVAKTEQFVEFGKYIVMHVASENPRYVDVKNIDPIEMNSIKSEIDVEMNKNYKNKNLKENVRENISNGLLQSKLKQFVLYLQPCLKDRKITISDMINDLSIKTGEKIVISRFVRYLFCESEQNV